MIQRIWRRGSNLQAMNVFLFLDDLLWMFSKTVLQQITEENDELHESLIQWFKIYITAENNQTHVDDIEFFKEQVMAGIVPSQVFPDIYMPRSIYYYITEHHNEHMCKWLDAVTNEDTLHPLTHNY